MSELRDQFAQHLARRDGWGNASGDPATWAEYPGVYRRLYLDIADEYLRAIGLEDSAAAIERGAIALHEHFSDVEWELVAVTDYKDAIRGKARSVLEAALPWMTINEGGDLDADMSDMRGGDDCVAGEGHGPTGGSGAQRVAPVGDGSLPSGGLGDRATDSAAGESGLAGGEPGRALEDLPGTEIPLGPDTLQVRLNDRVKIIDGQGSGLVGVVKNWNRSGFGHLHVTVTTDGGEEIGTLQGKLARIP